MPGQPAWLDMAVYCEGDASYILYKKCREMWGNKNITPSVSHEMIEKFCRQIPEQEKTNVRVIRNDWVSSKSEVWKFYFNMFGRAEKSISIMCSYFLPGRTFRKKISRAVKRGVTVKVILAGASHHKDDHNIQEVF